MKIRLIFLFAILLFGGQTLSAQTIEIGANYSSSSQIFYKNVPGMSLRYSYSFRKQYLFSELSISEKTNSYTESNAAGYPTHESYLTQRVDGELHANTIRLGAAQFLKNTDQVSLSAGGFVSLNYLKFDEKIVAYDFTEDREGDIWYKSNDESLKNRLGFGAFLDMEIKQIPLRNTALFSRVGTHYIQLKSSKNVERGISFQLPTSMISLEYTIGLRFHFKR